MIYIFIQVHIGIKTMIIKTFMENYNNYMTCNILTDSWQVASGRNEIAPT